MKKVIFLILVVLMTSLVGCGSRTANKQDSISNKSTEEETAEESNSIVKSAGEVSTSLSQADSQNEKTENSTSSVTENNQASEEEQLQEDMNELEQIGEIAVDNGILTVSVTIPAEMAKGATQEGLDSNKGEFYTSAVLNADGSVTYKMTKEQHRKMLLNITDTMQSSIQDLIDDEKYIVLRLLSIMMTIRFLM